MDGVCGLRVPCWARLLGLTVGLLLAGATAASAAEPTAAPSATVQQTAPPADAHGEATHDAEAHGGHDVIPPAWLVLPFVLLLVMIATGPLFFPHHWHHHYPKYAIGLGAAVLLFYGLALDSWVTTLHTLEEYFSFMALLTSLFVASGGILIRVNAAGTPAANAALLLVGAVLSNFIGTTGASMLLIRPFMRLNEGRIKPYHVVFFIFVVSNVGGGLTPIGDPPLFLGFLRGVPFFWTVLHLWEIWLPAVLLITGVFYLIDRRNTTPSTYTPDPAKGGLVQIEGAQNFGWLALIIVCVFLDPNILPWVPNLHDLLHVPFGIRELLMFGIAFLAYRTANPATLKGNDFSFGPILEVAYLFIGIFATMQPALKLIGLFAANNADALTATTFYFGTGSLSAVLDNAPTYLSFLSAAMGKFGLNVDSAQDVLYFATHSQDSMHYLAAISVGAVFFGAMTYIGNGPNFMVKAIAESSGVACPSFGGYVVRYALPILLPIYILVWLVFFSGFLLHSI